MKIRLLLAAAGIAFAAGVSNAQVVVFTDTFDGQATTGSTIKSWDSTNGVLTRASYGVGVRLGGIDHAPSGGLDFIVANGPHPAGVTASGSILNVANLFGGPVTSTISSGQQVWEPIGVRYDARSNSVIELENLTQAGNPPQVVRGLYGTNYSTGTQTLLQQERIAIAGVANPTPEGRAWHEGGTYLTADPRGVAGRYYVMAATGGRFVGPYLGTPNRNVSSVIWKVDVDATGTSATFSEFIDTADASFIRSSDPLTNLNYTDFRGITTDSNTGIIYATSTFYGLIVALTTDANGNFTGSSIVASGLDAPETIEYDAFTNTLVFAQLGTTRSLNRINLDGSGLTTLATDVHVRGITFVPTPGVLASLSLAGLAAVCRRRK